MIPGEVRGTDPQTSHDAANALNASQLERLVVDCIRKNGPIASDRVAQILGMSLQSISPRFRPLANKGLIRVNTFENGEAITVKSLTSNRQRMTWVAR
jgi:predicted transcriptional regulator